MRTYCDKQCCIRVMRYIMCSPITPKSDRAVAFPLTSQCMIVQLGVVRFDLKQFERIFKT